MFTQWRRGKGSDESHMRTRRNWTEEQPMSSPALRDEGGTASAIVYGYGEGGVCGGGPDGKYFDYGATMTSNGFGDGRRRDERGRSDGGYGSRYNWSVGATTTADHRRSVAAGGGWSSGSTGAFVGFFNGLAKRASVVGGGGIWTKDVGAGIRPAASSGYRSTGGTVGGAALLQRVAGDRQSYVGPPPPEAVPRAVVYRHVSPQKPSKNSERSKWSDPVAQSNGFVRVRVG